MSDPLPQLRPVRLQGKAYYTELKRILKAEGFGILSTLNQWQKNGAKLTPALVGALAIKHALNFKATCEFLEDYEVIPHGTYNRLTRQHRPSAILRAGQEWLAEQDGGNKTAIQLAFEQTEA